MTIWVGTGRSPPKSANILAKVGMTKTRMTHHDHHGDRHDGDRVDHGPLDLLLQLHRLFDVRRQPVQDGVEDAAHLAGGHQVDVEVVKTLGCLSSASAKVEPPSTLSLDLDQDLLEVSCFLLPGEDVQALHQRQPGVDHGGELAGEDDDVPLGDGPSRSILFTGAGRSGMSFGMGDFRLAGGMCGR